VVTPWSLWVWTQLEVCSIKYFLKQLYSTVNLDKLIVKYLTLELLIKTNIV
jgi:hypothetical protein